MFITDSAQVLQRTRWRHSAGDNAEEKTFSVRLSESGREPATHFGANSAMTADMTRQLIDGDNTDLRYYIVNRQGRLRSSNNIGIETNQPFTWRDALIDMNLKHITKEPFEL